MKRILHVVGSMNRAGAESMVMNLYRAIDKQEYQFDFAYFTEDICDFDDEITALGGKIYRIPKKYSKNSIIRTVKLFKLIKDNKPFHAVHCHQLFSNGFHLIAAYLAGIKLRIAHSHNTSDVNSKSLIGKVYQSFSKKLISNFATNYIACGIEAGKFLFGEKKAPLFIPNAVDVDNFINVKEKRDITFFNRNTINERTIIISQIGRLMPVKNVEFSLDFADYLIKKDVDFHLNIVGDGILAQKLKKLASEKELNEHVSFLGVRSDINHILGNTDLLLMPSFHEGFPVILVESQTAGIPALISNRISKEVDLGLNLVHFSSLEDNFERWEKIMKNILSSSEYKTNKQRHEVLKSHGFDINVSVKRLENVYNGKS
ncbi:glycosyltransferase [Seonamhaeicola sp. ML3]|uniref:glycosyltransferase n=1 Tax=Seonamhaeicola sp. ML3 TaxID=2937786 RepID=UPI00200D915F|nr:glycosyltransferase [Seonamhaeicola sp. ML3]